MNEKHGQTTSLPSASPATILNNNTNSINTTINRLPPALAVPKPLPQTPSTIFLLSTTSLDSQSINLNMIKCPWCDTNFEHIDIMTGHLMRYHRMTLAAAKVVVAEQMKIQGSSSSQLSLEFKDELERIRNEFTDKFYWKVSQPKVYLHQIDTRKYSVTITPSMQCFVSIQCRASYAIQWSTILRITSQLFTKPN